MKEEFENEVIEAADLEEVVEGFEMLSEEEEEETTGGGSSFTRNVRCLGTKSYVASSKHPTMILNLSRHGIWFIKKVEKVAGSIPFTWTGGATAFVVSRKNSIGTAKMKITGKDGDYMLVNVKFN